MSEDTGNSAEQSTVRRVDDAGTQPCSSIFEQLVWLTLDEMRLRDALYSRTLATTQDIGPVLTVLRSDPPTKTDARVPSLMAKAVESLNERSVCQTVEYKHLERTLLFAQKLLEEQSLQVKRKLGDFTCHSRLP